MMIGAELNLRISLQASMPSSTGNMMSSTMRSGLSRCAIATALRPSVAVTTEYPLRSRLKRIVCKIADSSSTTSIFLLKSGLLTKVPRPGFVSGDPFIRFDDRAIVASAVPFRRASGVKLIREPGRGHCKLHGTRGFERRRDVLAQEIERKAALKRTGKPSFRQPVVEKIVRAGGRGNHGSHRIQICPGTLGKNHRLGVGDHDVGDDDLIDQLHGFAHADRPKMVWRPHCPEHGL